MSQFPPNLIRNLPLVLSLTLNAILLGAVLDHFVSSPAQSLSPVVVSPVSTTAALPSWSPTPLAAPGTEQPQEFRDETPAAAASAPLTPRLSDRHREQSAPPATLSRDNSSSISSSSAASHPDSPSRPYVAGNSPAVGSGQRTPASGDITGDGAPANISPSLARVIQGSGGPGVLPAILAEPPPDSPVSEAQAAIQDQLAADFVAAAGNPADPGYKSRWKNAQWIADQDYRVLYGAQAFAAMQKQAYLQSIQATPAQ
ncbi:MAG: hypothetical protein ABJF10_08285 [Chthoniobacter sp.]|uniref:hypothetical protein n=1 Tax=Chthoniobacter sp. TaxID=2510640 RepID=UPI0032A41848